MAQIRPFKPGDEPAIVAVIKSVFDEYGWLWDPQTENRDSYHVEEYYHRRRGGFWLLESDEAVIGTVGLKEKEGKTCSLCRVYLLASQRGKGYGKMLYQHAIQEAKNLGYSQMEIWSDKTLDVSHLMYLNSGAKRIGDRSMFDPDYGVPYEEWGYLLDLA